MDKPALRLAVLSDYICPFCYIGYLRLEKLREHFELAVNWALVEIHPETPVAGKPLEELGYPQQKLDNMLGELHEMAKAEGVSLAPQTYTANSRRALLLAEASKQHGADVFYPLHQRLFQSFFEEHKNIGDTEVLRSIADECSIPADTVEQAWTNPAYADTLRNNLSAAVQNGATGTPTFFIGAEILTGAVSDAALLAAARSAAAAT